jgi:hypothetical protein
MNKIKQFLPLLIATAVITLSFRFSGDPSWQSRFVQLQAGGRLAYTPDDNGNIIPDFSRVGYFQGDKPIPEIPVRITVGPAKTGSSQQIIQNAIDRLSQKAPDSHGFRGTILLKKGVYEIPGTLHINAGGIVLRGEGDNPDETKLVATGKGKRTLLEISGKGHAEEVQGSRVKITDHYVAVGTFSFHVADASRFKPGDAVIIYRPGTQRWIHDLKMDQIIPRKGTHQWTPQEYNLRFERRIIRIEGNRIFIDNPIVMEMEDKYGGGFVYKYNFDGRIQNDGVEDIYFQSDYMGDTDEDHGWIAIGMNAIKNGWIRRVTSRYFGYGCVELQHGATQITVEDSKCLDAKSIITGGRRYSFCNNGQLNLFKDLATTEGRHDFVTGARTLGPNVFYHCTARRTHADIGPHHRWSVGTLYDNINTDGEINVQDRGNWGSGHGWAGVTQVIWNCKAKRAAVQNPWMSGKNYCIGLMGGKYPGRFDDRPDGVWEGQNKPGLKPVSLYLAQLNARRQNAPLPNKKR